MSGMVITVCNFRILNERRQSVSARTKLNIAAVNGVVVIAAIVGWLFGSWPIFLLTAGVLVAMAVHSGDIRPGR
jgi:hypothetical protein